MFAKHHHMRKKDQIPKARSLLGNAGNTISAQKNQV